jgi:hypothetical protein
MVQAEEPVPSLAAPLAGVAPLAALLAGVLVSLTPGDAFWEVGACLGAGQQWPRWLPGRLFLRPGHIRGVLP